MSSQDFKKLDTGKRRYSLLPAHALGIVVDVLEYGSRKYAPGNWAKCPPSENMRYYDAAIRHLEAWRTGDTLDEESGLSHLAHAACCILFLLGLHTADADNRTEP